MSGSWVRQSLSPGARFVNFASGAPFLSLVPALPDLPKGGGSVQSRGMARAHARTSSFALPTHRVALVWLLAASLAGPCPLRGQVGGPRGSAWEARAWTLGGMIGQVRHSVLGVVSGTLTDGGGLGLNLGVDADVEVEPALLVGGVLGVRLGPKAALRVRVSGGDTHGRITAVTVTGGGSTRQTLTFSRLGNIRVLLMDAEVSWYPWSGPGRIHPYAFGGVGASSWKIAGLDHLGALPPLVESPVSLPPVHPWLPSGVVGVGVAVSLGESLSIRLEASDQVSGNPYRDEDFGIGSTFTGTAAPKNLVHGLSISLGVHLGFGE